MDNSVYRLLYNGGLMVAIFFMVLTVFLFFWLKIPKVFSELWGRNVVKKGRGVQIDDRTKFFSNREKEKYYARQSEKIKVKQSSSNSNNKFIDKTNKDKTSGVMKKKNRLEVLSEDTSSELKFEESDNLKINNANVDFAVDNSDPETGLLYSGELGDAIIGIEAGKNEIANKENEALVMSSESETSVLPTKAETSVLPTEAETSVLPTEAETSVLPTEAETPVLPSEAETSVLPTEAETSVLPTEAETSVLQTEAETSVLPSEAETSVLPTEAETSVLPTEAETSVLPSEDEQEVFEKEFASAKAEVDGVEFTDTLKNEKDTSILSEQTDECLATKVKVLYDIMIVHSDEMI